MNPTAPVNVVGARQPDVRVTQRFAGGEDPELFTDPAAKFLAQRVQWFLRGHALVVQPGIQPLERAVAAEVRSIAP